MTERHAWGELAGSVATAAAAWLYGALPWLGWGLVGGVFRGLAKPPTPSGFRSWVRISLRSSLLGLVVGITLQDWQVAAEAVPPGLRPLVVVFVGFGSSTFLGLWDRAWDWMGANPGALLRWITRRPPPPGNPPRGD